jgi:biopolymer transport protein TolR
MTMNETGLRRMHSEINVTPMIDVLLVLLIIFMVIAPVVPKGEPALAPRPAAPEVRPQNPVVLDVARDSRGAARFSINSQSVSRQDLRARLEAIYANRAQRVLFIKGDDGISFAEIADAIDISHAAGIDRVGILTQRAAEGL